MADTTLRYLLFGEDKSASKTIKGVGDEGERTGARVGKSMGKLGGMVGGEVGEVLNRVGDGLESISGKAAGMGPKVAAGGLAVAGLGTALSMLGSGNVEADNAIKTAIANTGKSIEEYEGRIRKVVSANQDLAISDDETKNALAKLTEQTGDAGKALDNMGLVADFAASRHISLESAADAVGKMLNGNAKVFKQYGIQVESTSSAATKLSKAQRDQRAAAAASAKAGNDLRDVQSRIASGALSGADATSKLKAAQARAKDAGADLTKANHKLSDAQADSKRAAKSQADGIDQLSDKIKGRASDSVDTFAGKIDVLKTKAGDMIADFGAKYGPALQAAGVAATIAGTAMEFLRGRQVAAAAATAAATAAEAAQAGVTTTATGAQWSLNAALLANPIGLIIIAIVALVAAFVLLWTHSKTFRRIVTGAFDAVWGAIKAVWNWIKGNWPMLLAILTGPIGLAVLFIVRHWKQITAAVSSAVSYIRSRAGQAWSTLTSAFSSAYSWVVSHVGALIRFVGGIPGKIGRAVSGAWNGLVSGFKGAINTIIGAWNRLHFSIPGISIAGKKIFGGATINTPNLPYLAAGGTLTSAGDVIVGERGAERLTLPAGARVTPLSRDGGTVNMRAEAEVVVRDESGRVIATKLLKFRRVENAGMALGLG